MDSLVRNKTTAEQAQILEDAKDHPLRPGVQRSAEYFEILKRRRELPVSAMRQEFLDVYHKNQVVVLMSETGSGKTTQIPQFVLYDEYASGKLVACTQPRRLAATSVASRVADEMGVTLGKEVGCTVRFVDKSSADTRLKYMTDGLLLQGAIGDPMFSEYACVIIDEAHERTMATDILMALLKAAAKKRDDLKVVIMSATMDADKFVQYFGVEQPFNVPGRSHPVEIFYLSEPTPDWMVSALYTVKHISDNMPPGDILLFVPTVEDAVDACGRLNKELGNQLHALPLYAALSGNEQAKVLSGGTTTLRRCVVTTNVAETSLTIDGIVYVVDTGVEKQSGYNPRMDMETLLTAGVSQASARQRAGRAGRTQPGVCFRLYTEKTFKEDFVPNKLPGIHSTSISQQVLQLMAMGIRNVAGFDFLDPPDTEVYLRALDELNAMRYIDDEARITVHGRNASQIPIDAVWYNAILEGHKLGCGLDMVAIAAFGSVQNPVFISPSSLCYAAETAHRRFQSPRSDHVSLLNALHAYARTEAQGNIDMDQWCFEAFIDRRVMKEVLQIRQQVRAKVERILKQSLTGAIFDDGFELKIAEALARSMYHNAAINRGNDIYATVHDNVTVIIPKGSVCKGTQQSWVVFNSILCTGAPRNLQVVTAVKPEWLAELPFFQDDKLSRKRDKDRSLRQPYVKVSLDAARTRLQTNTN